MFGLSQMKTIPPPCPEPETGRRYWRSLDQLSETPEFRQWAEREFPAGASELGALLVLVDTQLSLVGSYLPPVFVSLPPPTYPPQTIILLPVHTAV